MLGTWMFFLGSVEFLARPAIRFARRLHLRRIGADSQHDSGSYDY